MAKQTLLAIGYLIVDFVTSPRYGVRPQKLPSDVHVVYLRSPHLRPYRLGHVLGHGIHRVALAKSAKVRRHMPLECLDRLMYTWSPSCPEPLSALCLHCIQLGTCWLHHLFIFSQVWSLIEHQIDISNQKPWLLLLQAWDIIVISSKIAVLCNQ